MRTVRGHWGEFGAPVPQLRSTLALTFRCLLSAHRPIRRDSKRHGSVFANDWLTA